MVGVMILIGVDRKGLTEEITFHPRSAGGERERVRCLGGEDS